MPIGRIAPARVFVCIKPALGEHFFDVFEFFILNYINSCSENCKTIETNELTLEKINKMKKERKKERIEI